jgi:hypothetical protein
MEIEIGNLYEIVVDDDGGYGGYCVVMEFFCGGLWWLKVVMEVCGGC